MGIGSFRRKSVETEAATKKEDDIFSERLAKSHPKPNRVGGVIVF
jgi:hypothetical protein